MSSPNDQRHAFGPGLTVAVIGAGISGVCAAAYLSRQGLRVTVFERSGIAGGVWNYDERVAEDSPCPNNSPSRGDYRVSYDGEFTSSTPSVDGSDSKASGRGGNIADLEVQFSPPGPCYAGLKNNVPTFLMASSWPLGRKERSDSSARRTSKSISRSWQKTTDRMPSRCFTPGWTKFERQPTAASGWFVQSH